MSMVEPIRVVHVIGRLDAGGAESRIMDIYRSLDRSQVQFDFVQHTEDRCHFADEVEALGGRIFSVPQFTGSNVFEYRQAWSLLFSQSPEWRIVHGHATSTGFIYLREAARHGVKTRIAHARSTNMGAGVRRWTAKLARWWATDLLAVSRVAAESEFGRTRTKRGDVQILPNAIYTEAYRLIPDERLRCRERLGILDGLALCHIGRLHSAKNHAFLLEVFAEVSRQRADAHLFIVGEGPCREEISKTIQQLDLINSVTLLGFREDVPTLLAAFDGLIFPSHYEGFPGVVLEAQASGLPCVISDTLAGEVKLTPLVNPMSLREPPNRWAEEVIRVCRSGVRYDHVDDISAAGYDVVNTAQWYQRFYISKAKG